LISIIVACNLKGVIGRNNQLPWHISEDLKRFKSLTSNHPIIMGRKTFESIGRPLINRTNIVISRSAARLRQSFEASHQTMAAGTSVLWADDLKHALELANGAVGAEEIFIIGGGEIYQESFALCNRVYLTEVADNDPGDTHFDLGALQNFRLIEEQHSPPETPIKYTFKTLERAT
jgi:dihydrofolate reductase